MSLFRVEWQYAQKRPSRRFEVLHARNYGEAEKKVRKKQRKISIVAIQQLTFGTRAGP